MARRKKKKSAGSKIGFLNKRTIFSILAIGFFLFGLLIIFSFLQKGVLLARLNQVLVFWLGGGAIFLPFLCFIAAMFFLEKETPFKQPNVFLGALLITLSFAGLVQGGEAGKLIWQQLKYLITLPGAFLLLLFTLLIGLVVLFNTSLDKLIIFFLDAGSKLKRLFVSSKEEKGEKTVFVSQEKKEEKKPLLSSILKKPESTKKEEEKEEKEPMPGLTPDSTEALVAGPTQKRKAWRHPPMDVLEDVAGGEADRGDVKANAATIEKTLDSFGIIARVGEINKGPTITQYALEVALGTKLSKITALGNDLALALAAPTGQIRIEAPIPGRSLVGIEVPNRSPEIVGLKALLQSDLIKQSSSKLAVPLGLDVSGNSRIADIARMPHVLIAGQTGAGKSVLLNSWIATILMRATPDEVKLILIDPKRVELTLYDGVPHLLTPVIHEPEKVVSSLQWAIKEMKSRYKLFTEIGTRNIDSYNEIAGFQSLPYILIVIDELADIMFYAPAEVEDAICRIAQMARATGIHLVLATQRPSVDVITGLIKANIPSRISFAVASMTDSRVILDIPGAEKLLGRGDMLYIPPDQAKPTRIQGPLVSEAEVKRLAEFLRGEEKVVYDERVITQPVPISGTKTFTINGEERDSLFSEAAELIVAAGKASASLLQRRLKIGYARAARVLDQLESAGIVGPSEGSKAREVLVTDLPEEVKPSAS